ncbi:hypothetical protein SRABI70_00001 [Pseudomonas sp. Bi70]|nr:hypothetical protein SRABI70_00001 [Pseudomonas sp. Bi70]
MEIPGGFSLAIAEQQLDEFGTQRVDLAMVAQQLAIATAMQHGQRVDGAVERQFAP